MGDFGGGGVVRVDCLGVRLLEGRDFILIGNNGFVVVILCWGLDKY